MLAKVSVMDKIITIFLSDEASANSAIIDKKNL